MSVGYTTEDKEIQSLVSTGIAVITGEEQDIKPLPSLMDSISKHTPSSDKSDDDDSEHGDHHMKGRVSPSPYTANTERARQFNVYVRNLIEGKLNILIPISHQPRELVQQIIGESNDRFPEFASSVRKRIRTYLKSYRRSRRVKDMQAAAALASNYHTNGLSAKERSVHIHEEPINVSSIALPSNIQPPTTSAIVTIGTPPVSRNMIEDDPPEPKKRKLINQFPSVSLPQQHPTILSPVMTSSYSIPNMTTGQGGLNNTEIATLKQLIQGYRESASFLNRAADQLEDLIAKDNPENI